MKRENTFKNNCFSPSSGELKPAALYVHSCCVLHAVMCSDLQFTKAVLKGFVKNRRHIKRHKLCCLRLLQQLQVKNVEFCCFILYKTEKIYTYMTENAFILQLNHLV